MNKRQAKIEALRITGNWCVSRDAGMCYPDDFTTDTEKILDELSKIGYKLLYRADKLSNKGD